MTIELPEYPSILMPHNLKNNAYLTAEEKKVIGILAERYMMVSAAIKGKWTYPVNEFRKCSVPFMELGALYLREYNNIFTRPLEAAVALLKKKPISPHAVPSLSEMRENLTRLQDRMARAVTAGLKWNYRQAEKKAA